MKCMKLNEPVLLWLKDFLFPVCLREPPALQAGNLIKDASANGWQLCSQDGPVQTPPFLSKTGKKKIQAEPGQFNMWLSLLMFLCYSSDNRRRGREQRQNSHQTQSDTSTPGLHEEPVVPRTNAGVLPHAAEIVFFKAQQARLLSDCRAEC